MIAALEQVTLERRGVPVLREVTLRWRAGERIALVGANGAGKTSLLRLLAGLERPTRGAVHPLQPGAGYVTQGVSESLFPWFSVLRNVAMPRLISGDPQALTAARVQLQRVAPALSPERSARGLSGGEAQAIALARALTAPGPAVLADEPFSSLAPGARAQLRAALSAGLDGRALLLVTHEEEDAVALGARLLRLADGRLEPVP